MPMFFPSHHLACTGSLLLIVVGGIGTPVFSEEIAARKVVVLTADAPISVELFSTGGEEKRPIVIILHGRESITQTYEPYQRTAEAVVSHGMDALLVSYYSDADAEAMGSSDRAMRVTYLRGHLRSWSDRIHDVVSFALRRDESSGKIALLGFSNGGFLAMTSAATDPRVTAIVVFYGGLPDPKIGITRLPPLLALHGDADRVVPISMGRALVEKGLALGGSAQLLVYPGAAHGFAFHREYPGAREASDRALAFLEQQLKQ